MINLIKVAIALCIRTYQKWISPLLGPRCRFYPSCSEYALISVRKDPLGKAFLKTVTRIAKCNPLHSGGVDWP